MEGSKKGWGAEIFKWVEGMGVSLSRLKQAGRVANFSL